MFLFLVTALQLAGFIPGHLVITGLIPDDAWKVAAQSGFNAILVLLLLAIQWQQRKEDRQDREKDRRAVNLLTRAVTEQTLAMAFLPRQFHDGAKDIRSQLESEEGRQ